MIGALFGLARPLIHKLDAEQAHRLTIAALSAAPPLRPAADPPSLAVEAFGLRFANPVGLAAGFDKGARVADALPPGFASLTRPLHDTRTARTGRLETPGQWDARQRRAPAAAA